jgi:hypothetical protein
MKLDNEFTAETRSLFIWNYVCFYCGMSHSDCLHHILGRISNSPYNACPINNLKCHIHNGKLQTDEYRKMLLNKTKNYLDDEGYIPTKTDLEFLEKNKEYYE